MGLLWAVLINSLIENGNGGSEYRNKRIYAYMMIKYENIKYMDSLIIWVE